MTGIIVRRDLEIPNQVNTRQASCGSKQGLRRGGTRRQPQCQGAISRGTIRRRVPPSQGCGYVEEHSAAPAEMLAKQLTGTGAPNVFHDSTDPPTAGEIAWA